MATGMLNLAPNQGQVATYQATQAQAEKPTSVGYDPSKFTVTAPQTVKQQVSDVIGENSPLLQQAKRRAELKATQGMTQRGMLNSSLNIGAGIEAGEAALYDKALPIATADASTYKEAATNTTNADNAAKYAKMQADNAASMRGAELGTNVNLANADAITKADAMTAGAANQFKQTGLETQRAITLSDKDTDRALQLADKEFQRAMGTAQLDAQTRVQLAAMDQDTRMNLAQVDRQTRVELSGIENNYRVLLQSNQDLATMYNQISTNIANIAMSSLSEDAKTAATTTQLNYLNETLAAKQNASLASPSRVTPIIQGLNLSQFFKGTVGNSTSATPGASSGTPGVSNTPTPGPDPALSPVIPSVTVPGPVPNGGFQMGGLMPGDPPRWQVEAGSPPPWPGAVKRGTTAAGGSGRILYDVYY
jgi:hypothetical protein